MENGNHKKTDRRRNNAFSKLSKIKDWRKDS